jgi:hypothetical protein
MQRIVRTHFMELDQSPETVFPLLCPVREYDWIADWSCEMVHTASGVAELDCVFRTAFPDYGPAVWTCSRYETGRAIDYVVCGAGHFERLSIRLQPLGAGARLEWTRVFTALSPAAEAVVETLAGARLDRIMDVLKQSLDHYLRSGELWKPAATSARSTA